MKRQKTLKSGHDWIYPYEQVVLSIHKDDKANWRLAVFGEDDFGMEKNGLSQSEAFDLFRKLTDGLTIKELREIGFNNA